VDLAIMRLSVFEMLYCLDIPNNVSISEAISLAHTYSDNKSARFLNGVLGAISRDKQVKDIIK
ncbi:MAG: N utilization substance protein B, partial [Christensenellaceae bacterium]|nr:N utilization substance protein B [Christensenellaceae bacterium]